MTTTTEPFTADDTRDRRTSHSEHGRGAHWRGEKRRTAQKQRTGSVFTRILVGVSGGALAYYGLRRRNIGGTLMAIAGSSVVLGQVVGGGTTKRLAARLGAKATADLRVQHSVLIMRSPQDVYDAWRNLERLPQILRHLEDVTETSPCRSHWTAKVLAGAAIVEWDAETVEERPGELLSWRSLPGSPVTTAGQVRFEPALQSDDGAPATMMHIEMSYGSASGGAVGKAAGKLFDRAVREEVKEDLRRFKAEMEAGEVPTTEGQPRGSGRRGKSLLDRVGGQS